MDYKKNNKKTRQRSPSGLYHSPWNKKKSDYMGVSGSHQYHITRIVPKVWWCLTNFKWYSYPNDEFEDQGCNEDEDVVKQFHQRSEEELEPESAEQSRKRSGLKKGRNKIKNRLPIRKGCRWTGLWLHLEDVLISLRDCRSR